MKKSRKTIKVAKRIIGDGHPTFVVAEIGLNHNGQMRLARKLIKTAKECGADAVKFQLRNLKAIYKKDIYKDPNLDSQATAYLFDIFKRFALTKSQFVQLKKMCDDLGIIFFCTPFDIKSADFLHKIEVSLYKIASGDLTNMQLITHVARAKKPIFLSTGMSELKEIDKTVKLLEQHKGQYALLHCVSTYPASFRDVNLKMIPTLKERYRVPVGYSGHERGIVVSVAAVALGACIIERHFTLDRSMEGPDHNISLMPEGLRKMINRMRVVEQAVGTGQKTMARGEILTRDVFSKSLVAKRPIKRGQRITRSAIDIKSPAKGLSPQMLEQLIGRRAPRDIEMHDYFTASDLND